MSDADQYRLEQARAILYAFEKAHRRPARDISELEAWAGTPSGKATLDELPRLFPVHCQVKLPLPAKVRHRVERVNACWAITSAFWG
jgi:hypothetical protein